MVVKIYWMIWAFIAASAGVLLLTGKFTDVAVIVFGFISFGMIFMGMMGVLPAMISHHAPPKEKKVKAQAPAKAEERERFIHAGNQMPVH